MGRALAEAIIAAARAGGYRRIRLDTQRDFGAAVALPVARGVLLEAQRLGLLK